MKFLILVVLISCSSSFIAQTPPTTDTALVQEILVDAEYPGGFEAMAKFIIDSLNWDAIYEWPEASKRRFQNKIIVRGIVETDGRITDIHVERASVYCPPCNREAINVVKKMPLWIPATDKNGQPERVYIRIPIYFQ
ncbi:MAG: energy transducer TonB [Flavobacteriia bacterium]|jgi:TonB family protein|nr:energy transducer TonB [Cryomorphaceae bacterium]